MAGLKATQYRPGDSPDYQTPVMALCDSHEALRGLVQGALHWFDDGDDDCLGCDYTITTDDAAGVYDVVHQADCVVERLRAALAPV